MSFLSWCCTAFASSELLVPCSIAPLTVALYDLPFSGCCNTARLLRPTQILSPSASGVFEGHGFNGRSAATYASKNILKWLSVDSSATSKDPKRRSRALESVCGQIHRGLARPELCGFDATSSGLAACFGIVQDNKLCLAAVGTLPLSHCTLASSVVALRPRQRVHVRGHQHQHQLPVLHAKQAVPAMLSVLAMPNGMCLQTAVGQHTTLAPMLQHICLYAQACKTV